VLDVGARNAPARRLYERHGFVPTGRTGSLPPPREHVPEVEMELDLGARAGGAVDGDARALG
jgi:ribosomal protein S18 acetylase RimI-like enzyme